MSVTPFCMLQIAFCLLDAVFAFLLDMYVTLPPQYSSALQNRTEISHRLLLFQDVGIQEVASVDSQWGLSLPSGELGSEVRIPPVPCTTLGPAFHLPSVSHRRRLT